MVYQGHTCKKPQTHVYTHIGTYTQSGWIIVAIWMSSVNSACPFWFYANTLGNLRAVRLYAFLCNILWICNYIRTKCWPKTLLKKNSSDRKNLKRNDDVTRASPVAFWRISSAHIPLGGSRTCKSPGRLCLGPGATTWNLFHFDLKKTTGGLFWHCWLHFVNMERNLS